MEINLCDEKIVELVSPYSASEIQERMASKRMDAFGQLLKFMQRPKWEEVVLSQSEKRLEPFWYSSAEARYSYDRRQRYQVEVAPEVESVTLYGQDNAVQHDRGRYFPLDAVEHCVQENRRELLLDPVRGEERDYSRYLGHTKNEVETIDALNQEGLLVVPPQVRSSFVVRKIVQLLMKTFQADKVHEERINVDQVILYYHPIYAFEYNWIPKGKQAVLEFDALTGEIRTEGGQIKKHVVSVLENDALFDIGSDTIGSIVPGANIAVKLGRLAARKAIK